MATVRFEGATGSTAARIVVQGRFDFNVSTAFKGAQEKLPKGEPVVVDLTETEYVDSSALGMILMLRRRAGDTAAGVRVVAPKAEVRRVLEVAKFDRLVTLEK